MQWEYFILQVEIEETAFSIDATAIWDRKRQDELTDWDQIQKAGKEGWELINVIPLTKDGITKRLLCMFKRPVQA